METYKVEQKATNSQMQLWEDSLLGPSSSSSSSYQAIPLNLTNPPQTPSQTRLSEEPWAHPDAQPIHWKDHTLKDKSLTKSSSCFN